MCGSEVAAILDFSEAVAGDRQEGVWKGAMARLCSISARTHQIFA